MREITAEQLPEVEFFYDIKHPKITKGNSFKYYKIGTMGVGHSSVPICTLDDVIDKSDFDYINEEIEETVPKMKDQWVSMIPKGIVPTFLNAEPSLDSLIANLDLIGLEVPENLTSLVKIREYCYQKLGLSKGWRGTLQLRHTTNFKNKCQPSTWKEVATHFPRLKAFIERLPIVSLGYVNVMMYEKGKALPIHRDTFHTEHSEHFININFHRKPKPTFIYDELLDKKHYLPDGTQCYFFNECDLHGVEATAEDYFTVRIDCKFDSKISQKFRMDEGRVFQWDSKEAKKYQQGKKIYVIDATRL